jgi:uncharacterized protein YndB with AHSA1/START domain
MTIAELSRIDRTIEIKAAPERVFRALTTAAEISTWFEVKVEGEIAPGNDVWMTTTNPAYAGMRFVVRIVEMTAPRCFAWQWHPGAVDPSVDYSKEPWTTVTFMLEPCATGTRLSVAETGFEEISLARRAKVFADNSQGWTEVTVWLQRYAESAH